MKATALLLIVALCLTTCSKRQQETSEASARRAVIEYVAASDPGWKIEGVSLYETKDQHFATVDLSSGTARRVINCVAWKFTRDDGSTYWRADADPSATPKP